MPHGSDGNWKPKRAVWPTASISANSPRASPSAGTHVCALPPEWRARTVRSSFSTHACCPSPANSHGLSSMSWPIWSRTPATRAAASHRTAGNGNRLAATWGLPGKNAATRFPWHLCAVSCGNSSTIARTARRKLPACARSAAQRPACAAAARTPAGNTTGGSASCRDLPRPRALRTNSRGFFGCEPAGRTVTLTNPLPSP